MNTSEMKKSVTLFVSSGKETGKATTTKLTIDFSKLSVADMQEYAIDSLVIKWRAKYKNSKTKGYPTIDTYIAPVPGTRSAPAVTPEMALATLFGEGKAKELITMAGGDATKVMQLFANMPVVKPAVQDVRGESEEGEE